MNFVRFLFILEKIIIVIIALCFIPIAVYVYKARLIYISPQVQTAYSTLVQQVTDKGFLVSLKSISECQPPSNIIFYQNCYNRCSIGSDCQITTANKSCILANNYVSSEYKICTSSPVLNSINPNNSTFFLNTSEMPLSSISVNNNQINLNYYCLLNISACSAVTNYFGPSISSKFQENYTKFWAASQYLMYYGLIPLLAHIIIVTILDLCFKFNLRLTNSLLIVHEALLGIGLIINGFQFNQRNETIWTQFKSTTDWCVIKNNNYCFNTMFNVFDSFKDSDNVGSGFNTAMAFLLVLQILCVIVIIVINILMAKYYKLREIQSVSSSYELHSM